MRNQLRTRLLSLSIRSQMLLMALIVALPAAGIIIFSGVKLRQAAITAAIQQTSKISDGLASEQQHAAASAEQLMKALAQLPDLKNHDTLKTRKILADILKTNPMYLNLSVVDPNGTVWASAITSKTVSLADRRYFRNAMATGRLSSGEYIVSRMASKPTINLCYPFYDESGKILGAMSVAFHLDYLCRSLTYMNTERYRYTLLDYKGIVLATSGNPVGSTGKMDLPEMFRSMQGASDEGLFVGSGDDGQRRFVTYRRLRLRGERTPYMYIRASIPVATVVAQANALLGRNLLIFASSLACALLVAWLVGKHSILDRVAVLRAASRRLARGDLKVRIADSIVGGDLGELGTAFDEMAQQLEARERERDCAELALRKSEARYRSLFDNSLFGIVAVGSDNQFERVNQAFCDRWATRSASWSGASISSTSPTPTTCCPAWKNTWR